MALTSAQLATLKADIAADPVLSLVTQNSDGAFEVAAAYNQQASPDFYVWRTDVSTADVKGVVVWTEYRDTSVADKMTFELMISDDQLDGSDPNVRQGIADVFAGPQALTTRNNLVALAKRLSTRAEALFATGTGSEASPATMSFQGNLSFRDVQSAWEV